MNCQFYSSAKTPTHVVTYLCVSKQLFYHFHAALNHQPSIPRLQSLIWSSLLLSIVVFFLHFMNATFSMIFLIARGAFRSFTFFKSKCPSCTCKPLFWHIDQSCSYFLKIHFTFIIFSLTFLILMFLKYQQLLTLLSDCYFYTNIFNVQYIFKSWIMKIKIIMLRRAYQERIQLRSELFSTEMSSPGTFKVHKCEFVSIIFHLSQIVYKFEQKLTDEKHFIASHIVEWSLSVSNIWENHIHVKSHLQFFFT